MCYNTIMQSHLPSGCRYLPINRKVFVPLRFGPFSRRSRLPRVGRGAGLSLSVLAQGGWWSRNSIATRHSFLGNAQKTGHNSLPNPRPCTISSVFNPKSQISYLISQIINLPSSVFLGVESFSSRRGFKLRSPIINFLSFVLLCALCVESSLSRKEFEPHLNSAPSRGTP
jgi:hypothetical protein